MNILIDNAIFTLQQSGGISTLWKSLRPALIEAMPDYTFDSFRTPDVFISTYYQPAPEGVKSIVIVYDWIAERYPLISRANPDRYWKGAAIEQASAVIAISQWTAQDTQDFTGKEASVAYPATSLDRASHDDVLAFKSKYGLPDSYLLLVGRRDLYKNANAYWQALKMMNPKPFTLCIGGENAAIVGGMHLRLSEAEMAAAYTGATCLVYPSLYEGFGLPVLEAYACGCPVICGDGGALAEINEAASVVNVTRPMELAEAIIRMQDHGARIEHILKGYAVAQRFSWTKMAQEIAAVIRRVSEGAEA